MIEEGSIQNQAISPIWKISVLTWGLFGLATAALIFSSLEAMQEMLRFWETREEYSHGYLIPVIAAFLIWQKSDILRHIQFRGSWLGLPILLGGLVLIYIGSLTTIAIIGQYGFLLAILGVVSSYAGWAGIRPILIPMLFLAFMIPFPGFFLNNLSAKLQLISSELGVMVIRAFGISVYLEGNVIDLGNYKLQVVEACSGLRYLFPLMSLAFMAAYFFQAALWKRAVIFLSSIPITILMNSFRIGVIGVLVEHWGIEQAEGFLHDFEGWVIFMACTALLVGEMWLFAKFSKDSRPLHEVFGIDFPTPAPKEAEVRYQKISTPFLVSIAMVILGAVLATQLQARDEIIPDRRIFAEFPNTLGQWQGKRDRLEKNVLDALKLDDYLISNYSDDAQHPVNFYVAYYASQRAGESAHSPRSCLPGGGWVIEGLRQQNINDVIFSGKPLSVNRAVIRKGDNRQLVYYWFQQRGRNITNEYLVKWYLLKDAIAINRTDGALIRLTTFVQPGDDLQDADERLIALIKQTQPILDEYIPR